MRKAGSGGSGMHGRDAELRLCGDILRRGRSGTGGVLLVEGQLGMGKTLLLAEAAKAAVAHGYTVVTAVADEFARTIPLSPLVLAVGDLTESADGAPADSGEPDPRVRDINRLRQHLETLASQRPVLVTVDDLHYADPVTLFALRMMPRQLAARPVSWVLARGSDRATDGKADAALLFDLLERDGAVRVALRPLPDAAVAEMITDRLGAIPDRSLLSLAAAVGGNPFLVSQLLDGLREENILLSSAGRASVTAERIPRRVHQYYLNQIESLHRRTRQLIEVAAVIGRSFAVEDVAEMLGQPPAVVLTAINEGIAAGVLAADGETLTFHDGVTWRAVIEATPEPLSRALHRQFGQVLLDRGNALQAAEHLVRGARQDDRRALRELDQVMRTVFPSAPHAAADLAACALRLTVPDDPDYPERLVAAALALIAAQRLEDATSLIDSSLAGPLPAPVTAWLHYALASVHLASGEPERARGEAEALLAQPDLPASVRDEATVVLLQALGELPDFAAAEQRAKKAMSRNGHASGAVVAAARGLQAVVKWNQGLLAASIDLSRAAVEATTAEDIKDTALNPALDLAARLVDGGQFDEASALIASQAGFRAHGGAGFVLSQARSALLRARIHLAAGRIDEAAAEAEAVVRASHDDWPHATLARCVLSLIALRRGDLVAAGQLLDLVSPRLAEAGAGRVGVRCKLLASQVAEARDGPAAAMKIAADVYDYITEFRWPLVEDPAVAPWLVRLALAVGDDRRAAAASGVAEEVARGNRAFPVVTAACVHAQGLLLSDIGLLRLAAETQPDLWASASAAEDLAVLLADADSVADAIGWFDHAYADFQKSGGSRGAARVRGRLRRLGVQRRHWRAAAERSGRGVDILTETERGIAELVCQGLTNRQIAEQTFVSANTIAFHLRNIYRKLGIASRVQLARVVLDSAEEYPDSPGQESPVPEQPRP